MAFGQLKFLTTVVCLVTRNIYGAASTSTSTSTSLIGSVHKSRFNANGCIYTCAVPDVKVRVKYEYSTRKKHWSRFRFVTVVTAPLKASKVGATYTFPGRAFDQMTVRGKKELLYTWMRAGMI